MQLQPVGAEHAGAHDGEVLARAALLGVAAERRRPARGATGSPAPRASSFMRAQRDDTSRPSSTRCKAHAQRNCQPSAADHSTSVPSGRAADLASLGRAVVGVEDQAALAGSASRSTTERASARSPSTVARVITRQSCSRSRGARELVPAGASIRATRCGCSCCASCLIDADLSLRGAAPGRGSRRGCSGCRSAASRGGRCRCRSRRWAACRIRARG
jgi:hypothetical protein